jgi:hypothetical protein
MPNASEHERFLKLLFARGCASQFSLDLHPIFIRRLRASEES